MKQENKFETGLFKSAVWQARVSIQRRLESGATKKFEKIMLAHLGDLKRIKTGPGFDKFHQTLIETITKKIKQNKKNNRKACSYGYAQKLVNIFLKYYIYWYNPRSKLKKYLHCPLDRQIMTSLYNRHTKICNKFNVKRKDLSKIDENYYKDWQKAISKIRKEYYPKRKYVIELDIMFWPKEND